MRAEYKRDMNHNFLILYEDEEIDTSSYQVRMLVGNAIPSVLKCRVQGVDGRFMIYYDITSRQSVAALFEEKKLGCEELRMLFGGFVKVMEEMSEYLLNPGCLVIQPEYMYVDMEKRELFFCYLPGFEEDVRRQFQNLTEYILPKINHEDGNAVMLGYGIYRRALEDSFHLEHIKEELYRERREDSEAVAAAASAGMEKTKKEETKNQETNIEKNEFGEDIWGVEEIFRKDSDEKEEKRDKENGVWKKIAGCLAGTAVVMLALTAKVLGYLPGISIEALLAIIIAGMGIGMLVYIILGRKRMEKSVGKDYEDYGKKIVKDDTKEGYVHTSDNAVTENNTGESCAIDEVSEHYGETVVLSAGVPSGPSSLVSREPGELATIYLNEDLTVIGKLVNAADAVINLPTVSRVHAKIRRRDGEYYLTDLNSRNGTAVNGQILMPDTDYCLKDQDEVDFAQARYIFLK